MIKPPQPSVGVMKWLALAEDLDDLSRSAGQHMLRRGVEGTTFSWRCRPSATS